MQQRRPRLGDVLDDYCPRERRITNHAVVAMVEDTVKQTRCTTCDAEHEYKQARVPLRRKKEAGVLIPKVGGANPKPRAGTPLPADSVETTQDEIMSADEFVETPVPAAAADPEPLTLAASAADAATDANAEQEPAGDAPANEDGPVHRRLIRATLPRPEGQPQDWKNPDFTIRQPGGTRGGGGFEGNRNGHRPAGRGGRRPARAQGSTPGQPTRFGGQRPGTPRHGSGQPNGPSNRTGGGRPGHAHGQGQGQRGPRPPGGGGRKRGR